jgi:hypothetical protein
MLIPGNAGPEQLPDGPGMTVLVIPTPRCLASPEAVTIGQRRNRGRSSIRERAASAAEKRNPAGTGPAIRQSAGVQGCACSSVTLAAVVVSTTRALNLAKAVPA